MNHRAVFGLALIAAGLISCPSPQATANPTANLPDRSGDYYRNEASVKGSAPQPLMPGSLWRVVAAKLNCRRAPGNTQLLVRQFRQGDLLQAEVGRGGADEVLLNAKDANGKPWMPVRGTASDDRCYVRANDRYIRPLTQP